MNTPKPLKHRRRPGARSLAAGTMLLSLGIALSLGLTAAPAQAAPVFAELKLQHYGNPNPGNVDSGPQCLWSAAEMKVPAEFSVPENTSATSAVSFSQSGVNKNNADDTMRVVDSVQGTAKATTQGGLPKSIELNYSGKAQIATKQAQSAACAASPTADLTFNYTIITAQPLWATLSYTKSGPGYAEAWIDSAANEEVADLNSWTRKGSGSTTVYLPAGTYHGWVEGAANVWSTWKSRTAAGSGKVSITFAPVGSATVKPAGKAQGYASLGSARSCAVHALPAKLSSSSKRIKAMKKISFAVNGKTIKTLKGRAITRGLALKLPIADTAAASVKTTVRLKSGKTVTAKASYRPCA